MTIPIRIGINGFGRIGRLALRAAWEWPELEFVHINDAHGDAASCAHLLEFDSVHGRWQREITATADTLTIDNQVLSHSSHASPDEIDWEALGVDVVLEATGRFKTLATLQPHFDRGARKVVVAAPVHDPAAINIVVGINDDQYDPARHDIARPPRARRTVSPQSCRRSIRRSAFVTA